MPTDEEMRTRRDELFDEYRTGTDETGPQYEDDERDEEAAQ